MWRDRWLILGIIGAALSCLACLTPVAVLALGAIGLGAWTGHLDAVLLLLIVGFMGLVVYRYWTARRTTSGRPERWAQASSRGAGPCCPPFAACSPSRGSSSAWEAGRSWPSRCATAGCGSPLACWGSPRGSSSTPASGGGAMRSAAGWREAGSRWQCSSSRVPSSPPRLCWTDSPRGPRIFSLTWRGTATRGLGTTGREWAAGDAMTPKAGSGLALLLLFLVAHAVAAAPSTVVLSVEGMTGGTGPLVVKRALEGLKGVQRADVSFHDKEARVMFEPTQVTVEQLIEAVNRSGFRASLKAERLNGLAGEGLFRYQPHGR